MCYGGMGVLFASSLPRTPVRSKKRGIVNHIDINFISYSYQFQKHFTAEIKIFIHQRYGRRNTHVVEYVNKCNRIHAVLLAQRESDAGLVRNLALQPDHLLLAKAHQASVLAHLVLLLLWSQVGRSLGRFYSEGVGLSYSCCVSGYSVGLTRVMLFRWCGVDSVIQNVLLDRRRSCRNIAFMVMAVLAC